MVANDVGTLSPEELAALAKTEVNEDPERLAADLQAIKEWLAKQPHLQTIRSDDTFIQFFLRGCKYSLERTKEKLDFFNSVRSALPEWFDDWDKIEKSLDFIRNGAYVTLKGFDKKGRRVFLFQMSKVDPNTQKVDDMYRMHFMLMEILMDQLDQSSVTGFVTISNCKDATLGHVTMMSNPVSMKKSTTVFQDAYPVRPKSMNMLNLPGIMENIISLFRSLLNEKMKDRMLIHTASEDYSKLQEAVGKDVLPEELGGTNGTIQDHVEYTMELVNAKKSWLKDQTKFKAEESKRPGKPKNYSDIFGMEGSFRQLNVD